MNLGQNIYEVKKDKRQFRWEDSVVLKEGWVQSLFIHAFISSLKDHIRARGGRMQKE